MGEPVTQGMFFEAMAQMRKDFDVRHRHIREDITGGFKTLGDKLDAHAKEDLAVEKRVQHIEDFTQFHKDQARKQAALASLGISGLIVIAVEAFKRMVGWQ